jgi:hypothetical protein
MLVKYCDQICKVIDVRTINNESKLEEIQFLIRCKHRYSFGDSDYFHYRWEESWHCKPVNIFESIMWGFKNLFLK